MSETERVFIYCLLALLMLVGALFFGAYELRTQGYNNFQATIKDLSEEQKCLHICGFEFHDYLENYKFCVEKCDRISERLNTNGGQNG